MKNIQCTNCAEIGHILRECAHPITSFGIIAYKIFYNKEEETRFENNDTCEILKDIRSTKSEFPKIKMLLIQRKDTIGYTDFVRGKYKHSAISTYFSEMTRDEQIKLNTDTFENIWDELWINHRSKTYRTEYEFARTKFLAKDVNELVRRYPSKYTFQEFGFPKGRRNIREDDVECAIREFGEETGYKRSDYTLSNGTLIEDFEGTDNIRYKHVYYMAELNKDTPPPVLDVNNKYQVEEIKSIGFFTIQEVISLIRDYDVEKKKVARLAYGKILATLQSKTINE